MDLQDSISIILPLPCELHLFEVNNSLQRERVTFIKIQQLSNPALSPVHQFTLIFQHQPLFQTFSEILLLWFWLGGRRQKRNRIKYSEEKLSQTAYNLKVICIKLCLLLHRVWRETKYISKNNNRSQIHRERKKKGLSERDNIHSSDQTACSEMNLYRKRLNFGSLYFISSPCFWLDSGTMRIQTVSRQIGISSTQTPVISMHTIQTSHKIMA